MSTSRKRLVRPSCEALEIRNLLSGIQPVATWIGQDGNDLVGRSPSPGPNGVQDIRVALETLPVNLTVTTAEVRGWGGGIWTYNGEGIHWAAAFVRDDGSPEADLFFEPNRVEIGRAFTVRIWYDNGTTTLVNFAGGVADPTFRMPELTAQPTWIGQDGSDRVGPNASVGPDGRQDAVIELANLSPDVPITKVDVRTFNGQAWQSGANPGGLANAELIRDTSSPDVGRLYLQPETNLDGQPLSLTIYYADATIDLVDLTAGPTDPTLKVIPPPAVPIRAGAIAAQWLGQSDDPIAGKGAAGVSLSGLPANRTVIGATLSSGTERALTWSFKESSNAAISVESSSRPLTFRRDATDPTRASIAFPPRGQAGSAPMTLRLQYDDGTFSIVEFQRGPIDATLRAPLPSGAHTVARPGDNLQALVDASGSVHLTAGVYELNKPLVLNRAITITADAGATLRFSQPSDANPWPAAIVIHHGNTTLDGFAVRINGPVRWDWSVPYEPAVILSTDGRDKTNGTVKVGLRLSNLDLQGPPESSPGGPLEYTALLANLVSAESGRFLNNTLRGGSVRVFNGPWEIAGNTYLGAMPGTWTHDVFASVWAHNMTVRDNVASPLPDSGKTYRFLVMTQDGSNMRVMRNRVEGIGPRDNDPQPHPNNPEVILTEAYHVNFEGAPLGLSKDGRILQIPKPQGRELRSGDVVAVLSGPLTGEWRKVAHVIDQQTLLLDRPLPTNVPIGAVSVSSGMVGLLIADNRIDVRGGSEASPIVLAGAHFNAEVRGNHLLGGAPVRIESAASERTVHWAWTHTPQYDMRIVSNTIEDSQGGLDAGMVRYAQGKSSQGRTYFDGQVRDNLFAWSPGYFARFNTSTPPTAMLLGDPRSIDPLEVRMAVSGNVVKLPPHITSGATIRAVNMIFNDSAVTTQYMAMPAQLLTAPTDIRLVNDTGLSDSDRLTYDPRLMVKSPSWAVGLEYRVAGANGFRSVSSPNAFLPTGLADGTITVFVRAIDDYGRIGPEAAFTFSLDTTPPSPVTPKLGPGQDTGISSTDNLTKIAAPSLVVEGNPTDTFVLLRASDGKELGRRIGPGAIKVGTPLPDGSHGLAVRRVDAAGNATLGNPLTITIDTTPPAAVAVKLGPGQDTGFSSTDNLTRLTKPTFQAIVPNSDRLILLRDGVAVDQVTGSGNLKAGGPLVDGSYSFAVRRLDAAGNASDGPPIVVTIDATPPAPVSGLVHQGGGQFRFNPMPGAVDYTYRVGNGPNIPLAGATAFKVRGLPFDPTPVTVRAIDAAGNLGAEAVVKAAMPAPIGSWIGQRAGIDFVGRSTTQTVPDGYQDIGIALTGLPTDRTIVSAEVRGWGGGIWQYNVPQGAYWRAALVHAPGSDRAKVFVQPYQLETGRAWFVRLNFSDGTTVGVNLSGGPVNPVLRTVPLEIVASASTPEVGSPANAPLTSPTPIAAALPTEATTGKTGTPGRNPMSWRARMAMIRQAQLEQMAQRRAIHQERIRARQQEMNTFRQEQQGRVALTGARLQVPRSVAPIRPS